MANFLLLPGPNSKYREPKALPAGFWPGLWHGCLLPFTFLISLFYPGVRIYETRNNGRFYDFGFWLGVGASLGPYREFIKP